MPRPGVGVLINSTAPLPLVEACDPGVMGVLNPDFSLNFTGAIQGVATYPQRKFQHHR